MLARVLVCTMVTIAACGGSDGDDRRTEGTTPDTETSSTTTTEPGPASTESGPSTTSQAIPVFDGRVSSIDTVRARMTHSWRPGCPVPIEAFRILTLDHWGYDGREHRGELVVHGDHAESVLGVFRVLFDARFPIERMELVDAYAGDDRASTLANNTAGFNCRDVVGRPGAWSEHAFGRALDLNPLVNPYVLDPSAVDPAQRRFIDRTVDEPGMIRAGDEVVAAFAAIGWQWGGTWSAPDYQHFSATGQ